MNIYEDSRTIKKPYLRTMDISGDVFDSILVRIRDEIVTEFA